YFSNARTEAFSEFFATDTAIQPLPEHKSAMVASGFCLIIPSASSTNSSVSKLNYQLLIIGLVVLFIGFLLMAGGGSKDPARFDPGMFSFRRVTFGPVVTLIGFIIEGVAIMYRPKKKNDE
ncbi:MAG: DUF3098 domain-containing protein, partial [Bacteroidales bacterium]|nr:DUF3098 domain-containing protein [Bacteroidales bacterium]